MLLLKDSRVLLHVQVRYVIVQMGLVGVCGRMGSGQCILSLTTVYAAVYDMV